MNHHLKEVTIVIVAFNSTNLLIDCLKSIDGFKIIIVDNGKNKKIFSKINLKNDKIKIISKNKNLGFPKAINFATNFVDTKYFLILNADTFIDNTSIDELLKTCKRYSNCGAAAAITELSKDGYDLFPENGKSIQRNIKQKSATEALHNLIPSGELCVEVSKIGLMINIENFLKVEKFSEKFFMFWEEVDLCKKFRNHNLSVIVNPKAKIIHNVQKSSKNDLTTFVIKTFHLELSPLIYYDVSKNAKFLYYRILKYFFRTCTYLLIFNFKKSLKNLIKVFSVMYYILL